MIRTIAVDDEKLALDLLEDNISKVSYLQLIAKCRNAFDALKVLEEQQIDLVFLDIQMPGLTGLQFIRSIKQKPMIILITAYEQYALESYGLDVVDYLVKPVAIDRFVKACNKALELYQLKTKQVEKPKETDPDYFFINVDYSLLKIAFADIVYIEGLRDYIKIHLKNSKPVIARMNVGAMDEQLPASKFIRVHKSYIVSIGHITAIRKNSVFMGKLEIPVSFTYRDALFAITGRQDL
jgi:two-component system, LytTR family, response regulator